MANVIALTAFESLGPPYSLHNNRPSILAGSGSLPLQYVRKFIAKQPQEYRLAIKFHKKNVGWWSLWQSFKRNHSDGTNLPSTKICEFMSVVEATNINTVRLKTCVEGLLVSGAKS